MTMMVRIRGESNAKIETPYMIFVNEERSYPIRGVSDNVPYVCYRTGPKGWMGTSILLQYLAEPREIRQLFCGRKRTIFVDNCSQNGHSNALQEALVAIRTRMRYLPPNTTDLIQPCTFFVIQKIKSAWNRRWEAHKISVIWSGIWYNSGKLLNPEKLFFRKLPPIPYEK